MEILVYRDGATAVEEGFSIDDLPVLLEDKSILVWVDLLAETPEQIENAKHVLLNIFNFHHLTVEDCVETRNQPKIEVFPDYLYFIFHGVRPGETSSSNFVTKELDGYLGMNYVVTFHLTRFRSIKICETANSHQPFCLPKRARISASPDSGSPGRSLYADGR